MENQPRNPPGEKTSSDHSHSLHGGCHAPADYGRAFAIGTSLNLAYVVVQVIFGISAHSLALLADAGHNLGDVLGLVLAWGASCLAARPPTERRTYGWRRTSVLAALANAVFLLVAVGGITWEAIRRFSDQAPVAGKMVMAVAAGGNVINTGTALLFLRGRKGDLNIRAAFMHMASDAAVSAGVVVAGFAILATGWHWLDPVVSLIINGVIIAGTWSLLREAFNLAVDAVPRGIDLLEIKNYLRALPGVSAVHDLHVWGMSTTENALTAHLVAPGGAPGDEFLTAVCSHLHEKFGIEHATIQMEQSATTCALAPDDVV